MSGIMESWNDGIMKFRSHANPSEKTERDCKMNVLQVFAFLAMSSFSSRALRETNKECQVSEGEQTCSQE